MLTHKTYYEITAVNLDTNEVTIHKGYTGLMMGKHLAKKGHHVTVEEVITNGTKVVSHKTYKL